MLMARFLVLYSTTDGHTATICRRIQQVIEQDAHDVLIAELESEAMASGTNIALNAFDTIIVGASIRYGKHSKLVSEFIHRNADILKNKKSAFFSVNIVARKADKDTPETNPYMQKFLRQIAWQPKTLAVFAGKLNYPKYRPLDRMMIRLIMKMTGGPTDPTSVIEFTDWAKVEAFARQMSDGHPRIDGPTV